MLLRNFGRVALAAFTALVPTIFAADDPDNPQGQSTFISQGGQVAFAVTVPEDSGTDVFFSLRVPVGISWGAVGLGSDDMPGALFLIVYEDGKGNVTFSPRLSNGHYEPKYFPALKYEILPGTGIFDDYMNLVVRCREHCRSWPSDGTGRGWFDVSSPSEHAVYAFGPKEGYASSKQDAPLKFHQEYGSFTIDMKRTQGLADAPVLTEESDMVGTTLDYYKKGKSDWKSTLHAVIMIISIVGLMPVGVVLLRFGGWVRWHALNQTVALFGVLGGFAVGIVMSFSYQRSRGFNSAHQIIGMVVVAFLLGQFCLGFLHHKQYRKTQQATKFGVVHRWTGRLILFLGTLNAFIGFTFALNRRRGSILAGLIILICVISLILIFGRKYLDKRNRIPRQNPLNGPPQGYQQEPWRQPPPQHSGFPSSSDYPNDPPPGYEPPSSQTQISLGPVPASPSPWRRKDDDSDLNLGSEQRPREFT